jgi:hypothetical protein
LEDDRFFLLAHHRAGGWSERLWRPRKPIPLTAQCLRDTSPVAIVVATPTPTPSRAVAAASHVLISFLSKLPTQQANARSSPLTWPPLQTATRNGRSLTHGCSYRLPHRAARAGALCPYSHLLLPHSRLPNLSTLPFPFPPLFVPSFVRKLFSARLPACVQILADFSEKARNPPASERFSLPPPSGRPRALINSSHLPPADSYPARSNSPLSSSGWCFASPGSGRLLAQFGLRTIGFDLPLGEPELESYPGDSSTVRSPSPAPLASAPAKMLSAPPIAFFRCC